jgi:hypothetical protein
MTTAIERIILGPEHKAAEVLVFFHAGQADAEQVRTWAMSTDVDLANPAELTAILAMVPAGAVSEIFAAQVGRQKKKADRGAALRITFAPSGRIVLNGVKLNQSAEGKGGMPLSIFPAQLSAIIDALPMLLGEVCDKAESCYPADEMDTVYNPAYEAAKKGGKTDEQLKAAGVAKFVKLAHVRAGKTLIAWDGCDRAATVAKFRGVLETLRAVK